MGSDSESCNPCPAPKKARFILCGPFQVCLGEAEDITPKGEKARAMLALLVTSPSGGRARTWI